jgi:hypothetical protein
MLRASVRAAVAGGASFIDVFTGTQVAVSEAADCHFLFPSLSRFLASLEAT